MDASFAFDAGILHITGSENADEITVGRVGAEIVILDRVVEVGRVASLPVEQIRVDAGGGDDLIVVGLGVEQPTVLFGGSGSDVIINDGGTSQIHGGDGDDTLMGGEAADAIFGGAGDDSIDGGAGKDILRGGDGNDIVQGGFGTDRVEGNAGDDQLFGNEGVDQLFGGLGNDVLDGGANNDALYGDAGDDSFLRGGGNDAIVGGIGEDFDVDQGIVIEDEMPVLGNLALGANEESVETLTAAEVETLLQRASAATSSNDAIIVVVDRVGRILGVQIEDGVAPQFQVTGDAQVFAVDGAVAKARTGAFFANNGAPLTSRTVEFISQTTITQREIESNPSVADPLSRGPGFVAPQGIGGHFPPDIDFTPHAALFAIEHTNRDSAIQSGVDGIIGTADDAILDGVFNSESLPGGLSPAVLPFPESFGGPGYVSRGIATLPGGIPLFKERQDGSGRLDLVGGIGVFFPGETGFASEENSALSTDFDPSKPDRSLEAEYIAFVAAGGSSGGNASFSGPVGNAPALPNFDLPFGRIDLDGITLPVYGPGNPFEGVQQLVDFGLSLGTGSVNGVTLAAADGQLAPVGWLIGPRDAPDGSISAAEVQAIIEQGINQATLTRAGIRLPLGSTAAMVLSVSDTDGNVLGLFRMPDATIFSIDVAVAKSRNTAYYADPAALQPIDQIPGVAPGVAFSNRTIRFLAEPQFPSGIDGNPPPFSILTDGGVDPETGASIGPPMSADDFTSVMGHDAFFPNTNFRDPDNIANQNGIVFFPGSTAIFKNGQLVGGLGVSGDGVEQDDVVTFVGAQGFMPPTNQRPDESFFQDVRLPYLKFNRNPNRL
ncbi:Hemolysin, chromosomal [Planctomycetes bacterium Pan216]|uniref:Hemolysin, chromosomal n=1 Tax=Kolteria novifilia TaxID=2527975 RepID=A0A518B7T8_9BACT|nr:Hemolysin, chromosomal [Planctomycetes bacterium Pan216]